MDDAGYQPVTSRRVDLTDACFAGVARQSELLAAAEFSSRDLVTACLDRIERHDGLLNSFRTTWPEAALRAAAEADEHRTAGDTRPLLGIPFAVKEDTDIAGLPTALGTDAIRRPADADSEVIRRVRAAGAVVVGRTRMPELGILPVTESSTYGVTRNPWSTDHTPGGSSGGSAAAVAAGLVGAALGSDGAGSIRIPASSTGLFGMKPQTGRISLHPQQERWTGMVALGPLARTVLDWALIADALRGALPTDRVQPPAPATSFVDAVHAEPGTLRVGLCWQGLGLPAGLDAEVRGAVQDTVRLLESLGHRVSETKLGLSIADTTAMFIPRYLRSIADSVNAVERADRLDRRTRGMGHVGRLVPRRAVEASARFGVRATARLNTLFERFDVLLSPVLTRPPLPVGAWEGYSGLRTLLAASNYVTHTELWNVAGNPAASVPAAQSRDGLPIGVQLVGRPNDECTLLSLAGQLERARPWADRRPSNFD